MTDDAAGRTGASGPAETPFERILGRRVRAGNNRVVGRIEEIRAERDGNDYMVTEILIGGGALLERLAVAVRLRPDKPRTLVARWDQIELDGTEARLTAAVSDLRQE